MNIATTNLIGKGLLKVAHCTAPTVSISPDTDVTVFTNSGAGAAVQFNLPPAKAGMAFTFVGLAAQNIVIDPNGTETISLAGTAQSAGTAITGTGAQNLVCSIVCLVDGAWKDVSQRGTWA